MNFDERKKSLINRYEKLIEKKNKVDESWFNGWYKRYENPVLTREHIPPEWCYDFDEQSNPYLIERLGINAVFNAGAMEFDGKISLVCRVEGYDRKSFFAVAESENGIDNFKFRDYPILMPETDKPDINVYDMRLVEHEDGWIYGTFCTERKDPSAAAGDTSSAIAQSGIARTKDLENWERLTDLQTSSPQQRNVVLHPEFVDGKYAFYTRPQDGFIEAGGGGGIAWGLSESIENAVIEEEQLVDEKLYHTVKEVKNGMGAPPFKTDIGWIHIAHGVRNTAAGLRYVLYCFVCDLDDPSKVIYTPGGYFMAPLENERTGDVSNVLFSNGAVMRADGKVFIYYASSDTRLHLASTHIDILKDYVLNTPADPLSTHSCVEQRNELIKKNRDL